MFTGIIQALGTVRAVRPTQLGRLFTVRARMGGGRIRRGESVAVNGVCLTVETMGAGWFRVRAAAETLRRTTLGTLEVGATVNLERSLRPSDRLGGHFVFGHVDATARLAAVTPEGDSALYTFTAPPRVLRYLVEKGSVALNGVSLTVFGCTQKGFTVCLIQHTLQHTNLGTLSRGAHLNVETDMLARYVERILGGRTLRRRGPHDYRGRRATPTRKRNRPPA